MAGPKKNPILIIGRKSGFLQDLLKGEGIISDVSGRITSSVHGYKLALVCDADFDKEEEKEFSLFCGNKGKAIVINPGERLASWIGLGKGQKMEASKIRIGGFDCQIKDAIIYNLGNVFYRSSGNKSLIFSTSFKNNDIVILSFDFLKSIYILSHGSEIKYDKDGIARADVRSIVNEDEQLHPQADILVRCLVSFIEKEVTVPRLWYFPNRKKCGVIFSHDSDESTNEDLRKITKLNDSKGIKSTTFLLLKTGTPSCWKEINKTQDVQLHQAYLYFPNKGKIGSFGNKISMSPMFGQFQKSFLYAEKFLLGKMLGHEIKGTRNHGLVVYRWNSVLGWMKKANLKFDSSLGSAKEYGYLYGHGLPYFLRQENYDSTNIIEFPLHFMDYVAYVRLQKKQWNYAEAKKILCRMIDFGIKFNSIITFDFHHIFLRDNDVMRLYLDAIKYSNDNDVLVNDMQYFCDFWSRRNKIESAS